MEPCLRRVPWHLLDCGPGRACWNMAVDEALLEACDAAGPDATPILRLYRWRPAAISLGRFQRAADVTPPAGVERVRRLTGGAALFHREDELTYAVVAPYALLEDRRPRTAYRAIHRIVGQALAALGVRLVGPAPAGAAPLAGMCYEQPTDFDLVTAQGKLVGSAQRRRGRSFLQHGAIPVSPDPLSPTATCLTAELAQPAPPDAVAAALRAALQAAAASVTPVDLAPEVRARAEQLVRERYGSPAWTGQR